MSVPVLLLVIAILIAAAALYRSVTHSDPRSVATYHDMMERLQQMGGHAPHGQGAEPATPHVRIIDSSTQLTAPRDANETPDRPHRLEGSRHRTPIKHQASPSATVSPRLVLINDDLDERANPPTREAGLVDAHPTANAQTGAPAPSGSIPPQNFIPVVPVSKDPHRTPIAIPEPQPGPSSPPSQVGWGSPALPVGRRVLFFDDYAPASARPDQGEPANGVTRLSLKHPGTASARPGRRTGAAKLVPPATAALAAVVVSAIALGVSASGGNNRPSATPLGHRASRLSAPRFSAAPRTSRSSKAGTSPTLGSPTLNATSATSTVPTTIPPAPGSGPQLAAVAPDSGFPGQEVTLSGSGLYSRDGLIVVRFGNMPAPVVCSTETTCQVRVPTPSATAMPSPLTVGITVTTDGGTSNSLTFTYV